MTIDDEDTIHDLIVIGAGSVGLTMAAAWAQLGHSAVLVERHEAQYGLPRAGHIDHEIMRLLQSLDAEGPTFADAFETAYYRWVNASGETLLEFPWGEEGVSGWHSDFMQNSAILEASLLERVQASDAVTLLAGWELHSLVEHDDYVELVLKRVVLATGETVPVATGETKTIRGRYVVGADGANSSVRRLLGIEREDLGFNEKWLVVDARRKRDFTLTFDSGQVCDPRRPTTILPLGKDHRRWEWHIAPDEDPADFESPERAWELLADLGITPEDVEPVRQLIYTFEARTARQWRSGRVFLAGDAAHTMPPFMGQGMCSGMRDSKNLVWKLDLVSRGLADDSILDTYEAERRPHVADWTAISLESGRLSCVVNHEEARRRDEAFRAGYRPPIPDFPQLSTGVLQHDEDGIVLAPAGELGVQGRVQIDNRTDLLDRLAPGRRFVVLSLDEDPLAEVNASTRSALAEIGVEVHTIAAPGTATGVIDVDGTYAAWMADRGIRTAVVRPDFYVFGGSVDRAGTAVLVHDLLQHLRTRTIRKEGDRVAASR